APGTPRQNLPCWARRPGAYVGRGVGVHCTHSLLALLPCDGGVNCRYRAATARGVSRSIAGSVTAPSPVVTIMGPYAATPRSRPRRVPAADRALRRHARRQRRRGRRGAAPALPRVRRRVRRAPPGERAGPRSRRARRVLPPPPGARARERRAGRDLSHPSRRAGALGGRLLRRAGVRPARALRPADGHRGGRPRLRASRLPARARHRAPLGGAAPLGHRLRQPPRHGLREREPGGRARAGRGHLRAAVRTAPRPRTMAGLPPPAISDARLVAHVARRAAVAHPGLPPPRRARLRRARLGRGVQHRRSPPAPPALPARSALRPPAPPPERSAGGASRPGTRPRRLARASGGRRGWRSTWPP